MRIKLTCCCGATIDVEDDFAPYVQKAATEWQERHSVCRPAPMYTPNPPAPPGYVPTGPIGPYRPEYYQWPPGTIIC